MAAQVLKCRTPRSTSTLSFRRLNVVFSTRAAVVLAARAQLRKGIPPYFGGGIETKARQTNPLASIFRGMMNPSFTQLKYTCGVTRM